MTEPHPPSMTRRFRSVAAATRRAGADRYVCAVGWETAVLRLEGAAGLVWEALDAADINDNTDAPEPNDGGDELDDLAYRLDVAADDPFLLEALDLLIEVGLVEVVLVEAGEQR